MAEDKTETVRPKRTFTVEFFVGIFTIVGVICFGYLAINLANIRLSDAGYYSVKASFDNISGLKKGASVEIAGVPVGEVSSIKLDETSALVTLKIKDGTKVRDDDIAAIRTKGIIGDRYIKISPGASDTYIESGGVIFDTESAVEFEEIIGKIVHSMQEG